GLGPALPRVDPGRPRHADRSARVRPLPRGGDHAGGELLEPRRGADPHGGLAGAEFLRSRRHRRPRGGRGSVRNGAYVLLGFTLLVLHAAVGTLVPLGAF